MWSQFAAAAVLFLTAAGCGNTPAIAAPSAQQAIDAPDLKLADVAFVRLAGGRVAARGVADELAYRRAGGRLAAEQVAVRTRAQPSSGLIALGELYLTAPHVEGEVPARRGSATGGVRLDSTRGDRARTQRLDYDGPADELRTDTAVQGSGPGYVVHSAGMRARADGSAIQLVGGVAGRLTGQAETPR
jgi:Lipopolysaccharide-assembly, LptC-related